MMEISFTIPEWLFWLGGGVITLVILFFAYLGFMFMLSFRGRIWK